MADDRDHPSTRGGSGETDSQTRTSPVGGTRPPAASGPRVPERIGAYRILRVLGAGGMGVVYEAEQEHPRRRVALKVIRGGHHVDERAIRMFEREERALARLKHPAIAPIHEVGFTEDGQHFYAMELVLGKTLGDFLEKRSSPTRSRKELELRIALFRKVCDAVNYAHQRGVIHRDLKPSNIMVLDQPMRIGTEGRAHDAPDVKVLDFGLARITDADAEEETQLTRMGQIQGTLAYMSPEQARGNPENVDLRTDIYSLGMILYEMLTGDRAYVMPQTSLIDAVEAICRKSPQPFRETLPHGEKLDRDLEILTFKALEKDPEQRYQSVHTLAGDLDRYLARQPILARPPSFRYQLRKAISRHKLRFAFATTVAVLVVALAVGMSIQAKRIARARDAARSAYQGESEVTEFLMQMFRYSDPREARGETITAREILDQGVEQIQDEFEDKPALKARLLAHMGCVYNQLGLYDQALPLLESSVGLQESRGAGEPIYRASSLFCLALNHRRRGLYDEAERLWQESMAIYEQELGHDHSKVMECLINLGALYIDQGKGDAALTSYGEAIDIANRIESEGDEGLGSALNNVGVIYRQRGELERALEYYSQALEIREIALGAEHPDVASTLNNIAEVYRRTGRLDEARPLYLRCLRIREKVLGENHPRLALVLNNLGELAADQEQWDLAESHYRRALEILEAAVGPEHSKVGTMLFNLARVDLERQRYRDAEDKLRRALAICEHSLAEGHPYTAETLAYLGTALCEQNRYEDAEAAFSRSVEMLEAASPPDSAILADALRRYAVLLRRTGRTSEGERAERKAEQILASS